MKKGFRGLALAGLLLLLLPRAGTAQEGRKPAPTPPAAEPKQQANAAEPTAPPAPVPVTLTADENGFQLKAADDSFVLRFRGDAQFDGRFLLNDPDQLLPNSFSLRRVRPAVQGTVFARFDFLLRADFGQGTTQLLDASLSTRLAPELSLQFGQFKAPLGLERLQSSTDLALNELALPTELVPNRDVGVMLHGSVLGGRLDYAVALLNGAPDGRNLDVDLADGKEVAARLFAQPFRSTSGPLKGLGLGLGVTLGSDAGSVLAPALPAFRASSRQVFFCYRQGTDAATTVVADGQHLRLAPQAYYYAGPVGLLGEYVRNAQMVRLGETTREVVHTAWQVTGAVLLTGESATYRRLRPKRPFNPNSGQWGAFELVGRLHALDADADAFPIFADPARSVQGIGAWAVGVNWYLNANVRVMLSYEQARFEAAEGGAGRDAEQLVLSRFQFVF